MELTKVQTTAIESSERASEAQLFELQLRNACLSALDGNRESYVEFLTLAARLLRRYLAQLSRTHLSKQDDVEDLVQEVLILLHEKLGTYRRELPVIPWILSIARYRAIDFLRSEKRVARGLLLENEIRDYYHRPFSLAEETVSRAQEIESLLRPLTPLQKEVLMEAKAHGAPLCEIGDSMGMTVAAVKVTIHRALSKIRSVGGIRAHEDE